MVLTDPGAANGLLLFAPFGPGQCGQCHNNGGANFAFGNQGNRNFNTGVELFLINNPDPTGEPRPIDGGFGRNPGGTAAPVVANPDGSFGNETFNTPSLIEFADTLPGFHNNITLGSGLPNTVESGVAFYNSAEFEASPEGALFDIDLSDDEVADIGKLLRVVNAMENQRSAMEFVERALDNVGYVHGVKRLTSLAVADIVDAIQVLREVGLHPRARYYFRRAKILLSYVPKVRNYYWRRFFLRVSIVLLQKARADMVVE